ncbi:hypothetical protein P0Y35_16730 [Kiritimatiellaeota bacterium B1221]|nr:hypothetical protein [Kiritimatiellaeota bacterium B1221]
MSASPYHHPDQPVRHSYPLAIENASLGTAFGLLRKTFPYALVRFGILLAFSVGTIIWFAIVFGGAALLSKLHEIFGGIWMIGGIGLYGWFFWTVIRYFLYMIKAGHIAVITELVTTGSIDNGERKMFEYGKDVVKERFKEISVLFALDLLIKGVVKSFNRTLEGIANFIPLPGVDQLAKVVGAILHAMTTFIDETLFSYNLARGDDNPWRSGRDGLIYYAQNAKEILKTSLWIVVLEKVLVVVAWIICMAPAALFAYLMPGNESGTLWMIGIAALFAWNIKSAFLHPLFLIMIMIKFHVSVKGQAIDETWDDRLTRASGKFSTIKDKMKDWAGDRFGSKASVPVTEPTPLEIPVQAEEIPPAEPPEKES